MAAACAPSRASLLTGQYPSLHGVTQTDGLAKTADGDDMFWLAPDTVPTLGDWFRAGGYRTYFKGKWHASHAHLDAEDGDGYLLSIDDDGDADRGEHREVPGGRPARRLRLLGVGRPGAARPRQAQHGHGQGPVHRRRDDRPPRAPRRRRKATIRGCTVCSFLNPHDDSLFGVVAPGPGTALPPLRGAPRRAGPDPRGGPLDQARCQQSYTDAWGKIVAPQPWIETHLKFYYQLQATVGEQITRVLDALLRSPAFENTIVVFSSDHGDMQGAHGGMHEKWHVAYEEALHVPFIVSSPCWCAGRRARARRSRPTTPT